MHYDTLRHVHLDATLGKAATAKSIQARTTISNQP